MEVSQLGRFTERFHVRNVAELAQEKQQKRCAVSRQKSMGMEGDPVIGRVRLVIFCHMFRLELGAKERMVSRRNWQRREGIYATLGS